MAQWKEQDWEGLVNVRNRLSYRSKICAIIGLAASVIFLASGTMMIRMPGHSYLGALPPPTDELRALEQELHSYVQSLAGDIGERNLYHYDQFLAAAEYIRSVLTDFGYEARPQSFDVNGQCCKNIEAEVRGTERPNDIIVIGAHYDTVKGSPGANDNGTGVAATLALANRFRQRPVKRTIRFVAFANEEDPFFNTPAMGSRVYAQRSKQRGESIHLMISLETIGYYSDQSRSQRYPAPLSFFYPDTGNFIAFVSNMTNVLWVRRLIKIFRQEAQFPSEGAALWEGIPGVGWSDHWAFWKEGFPAVMVTDTALFRYPYYHKSKDTPDKVHYGHLSRVVSGLERVIMEIANQ